MSKLDYRLCLASGSPQRIELLDRAGIVVDGYYPSDIDESPKQYERANELAGRLARAKAEFVYGLCGVDDKLMGSYILAADTVVSVGTRVLQKPEDITQAEDYLDLLSGRNHRVYTGICVIDPKGYRRDRLVKTRVKFKRLSSGEKSAYLESYEWEGKAGGYNIQGIGGNFVIKVIGSYSSVVGLPVYESVNLLIGSGYPVYKIMVNNIKNKQDGE